MQSKMKKDTTGKTDWRQMGRRQKFSVNNKQSRLFLSHLRNLSSTHLMWGTSVWKKLYIDWLNSTEFHLLACY